MEWHADNNGSWKLFLPRSFWNVPAPLCVMLDDWCKSNALTEFLLQTQDLALIMERSLFRNDMETFLTCRSLYWSSPFNHIYVLFRAEQNLRCNRTCETLYKKIYLRARLLVIACMAWYRRRRDYNTGVRFGTCLCLSSVSIIKNLQHLITLVGMYCQIF